MSVRRQLVVIAAMASMVVAACAAAPSPDPSPSRAAAASVATPTSDIVTPQTTPPSPTPEPTPRPSGLVELGPDLTAPLTGPSLLRVVAAPDGFAALGSDGNAGIATTFLARGSADGRMWRRLDTKALGAGLLDLAIAPNGWVMEQQGPKADQGEPGIRLWWSSDGVGWIPVAPQAGMDAAYPGSLFSGPRGFALIGQSQTPDGNTRNVIWTSADGRQWTAATSGIPLDAAPDQVLITPDGFVALETGQYGDVPAAWSSPDGATWSTEPAGHGPFGKDGTSLLATTRGSDLVLVRSDGTSWTGSPQGSGAGISVRWEQHPEAASAFAGKRLTAMSSSAQGVVALGWDVKTRDPFAWSSPDGVTWHATALGAATFDGGAPALLATSPATSVAFGWKVNGDGIAALRPWVSADAQTWAGVDEPGFGVLPPPLTGPCPSADPTTIKAIGAVRPELRPTCFGHRSLTLRGYVTDCGGCGGTTTETASPSWLIDPMGYVPFYMASKRQPGGGGGELGVVIDPAHRIKAPRVGAQVDLTGHFDDAASTDCRVTPVEPVVEELAPPAKAIATCRQTFVAEAVRTVAP